MKLKPIRAAILTLNNGTEAHVERIGKGRYSTAWKNGSAVYVQTHEKDYGKELLCQITGKAHLPVIEHIGTEGIYNWYKMPLYQKLTAKQKEAWLDYRHLQGLQKESFSEERAAVGWRGDINPASVNDRFLDKVRQDVHLVNSHYDAAIESLVEWCSNYGETWLIEELQARNCAVDANGELILLDPVFDLAEVRADQKRKSERAQRRY